MNPNRLEELRAILLRPDQEKLEELRARIEGSEQRAADVAEVLPDSVAASFKKDSRLIGALRTPLRQCVSESVREDPEAYADALFPVMGPSIRRAVAEAFKAWIQQANQALEQAFSPRQLAWRFEAWRAGIPYGEYVLQRTLAYRVEDVYLVHAASGLLIGHVREGAGPIKDEDAVSAMFTAIQEFVKDSFSREHAGELTTAEVGELTLWAVHGPTASIIAVIRGVPRMALRAELERTLELIETRHSQALRNFSGDRASMAHLEPELRSCLLVSGSDELERGGGQRLSLVLLLAALIVAGALGWLGYNYWLDGRVARLAETFEATPGIVVTRLERDGRTVLIRGLRDPLAPRPSELVAASGWSGEMDEELTPFLSLEDDIVVERARATLAPPDTVTMEVEAGVLTIRGSAPAAWISEAESAGGDVPGVDRVAMAVTAADPLAQLRLILSPPATVVLELDESVLVISGDAEKQWFDGLPAASALPGVESIDDSGLVLAEQRAMQAIVRDTNATAFQFDPGQVTVPAREADNVARIVRELGEFESLARLLGLEPRLTITGHSDDTGTVADNIDLEQQRAASLAAEIRAAGIDAEWIVTRSQLVAQAPGARVPQVTFELEAVAGSASSSRD